MAKFIRTLSRHLSNIPGWRTERKIVVIESDDWGSIRMPSLDTLVKLKECGLDMVSGDSRRYNKYDTLANSEDLQALFETLLSIEKKFLKRPVFTAISLSANPDFDRIRENKFSEYIYEPFTTTLEKYGNTGAFDMWREGIKSNIFIPEFHGREHLNIAQWMRALQGGDEKTLRAFNHGCWCFRLEKAKTYQAAFFLDKLEDLNIQKEIIEDGVRLFESLHDFRPSYFVAPNGFVNNNIHNTSSKNGIRFLSGSRIQKEPQGGENTKTVFHWLGQKNRFKQIYITRNAFFEPSKDSHDWNKSCLKEIEIAFKWSKPAIISSHRVNYIGGLSEFNRKKGLDSLYELLSSICRRWPEVEFLSSRELGELIKGGNYLKQ